MDKSKRLEINTTRDAKRKPHLETRAESSANHRFGMMKTEQNYCKYAER